jgi:hypothetical protein
LSIREAPPWRYRSIGAVTRAAPSFFAGTMSSSRQNSS